MAYPKNYPLPTLPISVGPHLTECREEPLAPTPGDVGINHGELYIETIMTMVIGSEIKKNWGVNNFEYRIW